MSKVVVLYGPRGERVRQPTIFDLARESSGDGSLKSIIEALAIRNGLLQDAPYRILDSKGRPYLRVVK